MILAKRNKVELHYILFEVTEKCNLACSFCYNHWKRNGYLGEETEVGYGSSLKTLKKLFRYASIKHVTFTGGEPMLAERIGELILFCRMKGATVSVITNGNAGKKEDFAQLIKLGTELFELPVHSANPVIHDRMTHIQGSWEKSVGTIRLIKNIGGYIVPVVVVTKYNWQEVGETFEFIHSLGFNRIMLNRYNIGGKASGSPEDVSATKEELNEAFRQANEISGNLNLTVSSNVCTPHCVIDPLFYRNIRFSNCSTDLLHRPLTLTARGDLRFCNHSPNVLGNIYHDSIENILKIGAVTGSLHICPEICTGCLKYEKCLGGCRAAAEQAGGTFSEVDPIVMFNREFHNFKIA